MSRMLLLSVRFHDGRYHGNGDWPPAPARVFQALVAANARGRDLAEQARQALCWLEALAPPVIAAPRARMGQRYTNYVLGNDLDAALSQSKHGGNIDTAVASIRVGKTIYPRLFDAAVPVLYLWTFDDGPDNDRHAACLCGMAENLYQLGCGVDMAWARGVLLDPDAGEGRLAVHDGRVYRPGGNGQTRLSCPGQGALNSLLRRHRESIGRFSTRYQAKPTRANPKRRPPIGQVFTQPPKPRFAQVAYDSPPRHRLYEMRDGSTTGAHAPFAPQPVCDAVRLVGQIRDRAAARLCTALGTSAPSGQLDRLLVGRGAGPRDKSARIRLVPLPSIGHTHADYRIRRLLVEVPPDYPLNPRDIDWAFDGLDLGMDPQTGAAPRNHGPRLLSVPTNADKMLAHYGIGNQTGHTLGHTLWRTVTPAVLPRAGGRKSKQNRPDQGARAVATALRHAGITARPVSVRVQREPFDTRGARAESFAVGRFAAAHMWHLELGFAEPVDGPLVIGDGRYVGLGLMRPVPGKDGNNRGLWVFAMPQDSRIKTADTGLLLTAVRRALMALSRDAVGRDVPPMFSGHEPDGTPARSGRHKHVFLAADDTDGDGRIDRLLIAAPWICDPSRGGPRDGEQVLFDRVVSALSKLRAGPLGILEFTERGTLAAGDPVVGPGQTWTNRTRYSPTRHGRDPKAAVRDDVVRECQRRGWPAPHVELLDFHAGPRGGGVLARLRLRFATAIEGPLLLGRDCHRGGGLFVVETGPDNAIR